MDEESALSIEIPSPAEYETYLHTGRQAYTDHYCHLWPKGDPSPYCSRNFTRQRLEKEMADPGLSHWLVRWKGHPVGICKIDFHKQQGYGLSRALFLEKIYLLREYTGKGLGKQLMGAVEKLARDSDRMSIWLKTMKKGRAQHFYRKLGYRIIGESAIPYPEVLPGEMAMWVMGLDLK